MASRRLKYTFQLTGYATESNEKNYICCFMRVTHAINNIYKLISFFDMIDSIKDSRKLDFIRDLPNIAR